MKCMIFGNKELSGFDSLDVDKVMIEKDNVYLKIAMIQKKTKHLEQKHAGNGKRSILICFVALTPLWLLYALLILNGKGLNPQIFIPTYNDEVAWFTEVESMIHYGASLGYEGYNGTHASIGTFGPWGVATLVPYALIGKLIGWEFHSMIIANGILLSAAILIFILLTKPSIRQLLWISLGYVSMSITVGYSMLSMAESLRYALAIVMAGMLIKLYRREGGKLFTFLLLPVVILFSIQVYLIFALIVPVYLFLLLRDRKMIVRLTASAFVTAVAALLSNHVLGLVTAPYTESTRTALINGIMKNPYQGTAEALKLFMSNLETVNPVYFIKLSEKSHGIMVYFFIAYLGLMVFLVKRIREEGFGDFYKIVSLYLLLGFLLGYCALYTGGDWTLCRGANTAVVFAVFFLLFEQRPSLLKYFALFSLVGVISSWQYYADRIEQKDVAYALAAHIPEEREKISKIIDISREHEAWGNTIAHYGEVTNVYLELPIGAGTNYMENETINTKARWAAVSKCEQEYYAKRIERLIEGNHRIVYENDDLTILEFMGYE